MKNKPLNPWMLCSILLFLALFQTACNRSATQAARPGQPEAARTGVAEPEIRVCLADRFANGKMSFQGEFMLELEEAVYQLDETVGELSVFVERGELVLRNSARNFELVRGQSILFKPVKPDSRFVWNGVPYVGKITLHYDRENKLVINTLPLEVYLKGVVPHEIPSSRVEYKEAVYSQAIAARTYAYYRVKNPQSTEYDLYADSRDQVYKGDEKSTMLSDESILNTRGVMVFSAEKPVLASYHSTCGGVLETVAQANGGTAELQQPMMFDLAENDYNCNVSPHYRWVEDRQSDSVVENLGKEFDIDAQLVKGWLESGYELNLSVGRRSQSGRILEMEATIGTHHYVISGYQIRRVLGGADGKDLPSNYFFVNKSPSEPDKLYIIGAGAGHGLGMCQWGAIGMALKGYMHENILGFYYPDFGIKKLY